VKRSLAFAAVLVVSPVTAATVMVGAGANEGTPDWKHVIVVDKAHPMPEVLQAVFHEVAALGIGDEASARVLKRVGDDFIAEVAANGKATLSIGTLVDALSAAKTAKWSAQDMSRLVLALDRELDDRGLGDIPRLQLVVARVRKGAKADEILGTGDTLKAAAAR
jgi:hypothetical protein